jgi:phage pi2 protein 07
MKGNKKMKCEVIKIEIDPIRILKHEILNKDNFNVSKWTREDLKVLTEVVKTLEESLNSELHFHFHTHPDMEIEFNIPKDHVIIDKDTRLYFHTHPDMEIKYNIPKDHVIIDRGAYEELKNRLDSSGGKSVWMMTAIPDLLW